MGIPLGFLTSRIAFPGRRIVATLLGLPAVLPPLVGVLAFMFLFGETGFLARMVQSVTGMDHAPWRLEGAGAVLLVHVATMYVYFYLFTRAGLAGLDPSLAEAAASLGADRWGTFRRVTLPLLRPALSGAGILVFMTSLASFSAPVPLRRRVPGHDHPDHRHQTERRRPSGHGGDRGAAAPGHLGLLLLRKTEGVADATGARKGVGPAPAMRVGPLARVGATVLGWTLALLLTLPLATLLLVSFVPRGTWTMEALPPVYSLVNYRAMVADPARLAPLVTSLWMAAVATVGALLLALAGGGAEPAGAGPLGAAAGGAARPAVGGAGHGVRDRARHYLQRARAVGRAVHSGRDGLDPSAGVPRKESADRGTLGPGGIPATRSIARGRGCLTGRGARAGAPPGDSSAAVAGARRGRVPGLRHRLRGLRDLDHALHLRHPADLDRDPVEPPAGRRGPGRPRSAWC